MDRRGSRGNFPSEINRSIGRGTMASIEIDRRFRDLMGSGAFLYALVDTEGFFLMLNRGMESFLRRLPDTEGNILSYCPDSQIESLYSLLSDARHEFIEALVPLVRTDGTRIWLNAEFMPAEVQGREAVQIIGIDMTELMKLQEERQNAWSLSAPSGGLSNFWGGVLDSCPGLLCCVVNRDKKLLYASPGYKSVALRVLGHNCEVGKNYPPELSELDKNIKNIIYAALDGESNSIDINENFENENNKRVWNLAAAPLKFGRKLTGAVMRFMAVNNNLNNNLSDDKGDSESKADILKILNAFSERAVIINERGVIITANDLFMNLFNLNIDKLEAENVNLLDLIPADNNLNNNFHKSFLNNILITRGGDAECRVSTKDGDVIWLDVHAKDFSNNNILLNFIDVTRLKRTQAQLRRVTVTDGTTGILNRQGIERLVIQKVERSLRDKSNLSLIIFDVDGFRRVNESLGYSEADRLLKVLSLSLKSVLSREDAIGRWGGDEFIVLTPKAGEPAKYLADTLRSMAKNFDSGTNAAITLSAGVAELGAEDHNGVVIEDHAALIAAAYDAMILAKHKGGDVTCTGGILAKNIQE